MELCYPLLLGVVAIEKGVFGSPSTMVAYFTHLHKDIWNMFHFWELTAESVGIVEYTDYFSAER